MFCFFDFNLHLGGAQIGTISLCSRLRDSGSVVIIYDAYGKDFKYLQLIEENNIGFRVVLPEAREVYVGGRNVVHRLGRALFQLPGFARLVLRLRRNFSADNVEVVWVNNIKSLVFVYLASLGLGVKRVLYHRGWAQEKDIAQPYRWVIRMACDALIGHSAATVANLQRMFPEKKVLYVPNAVQIDYDRITAAKQKVRSDERWKFVVILPAARPVKEKGHDVAVRALLELKRRGIDGVKLIFPGDLPVSDSGEFVESLTRFIEENGLSEHVEFIGWVDGIAALLAECDVAILPSHTEGFPRVVIEAMLVGTPVIATPVGGVPEAIIHKETGLIVGIDDFIELANSIETLFVDRELRDALAERARKFAINHFSAEKQATLVKRLFISLASRRD